MNSSLKLDNVVNKVEFRSKLHLPLLLFLSYENDLLSSVLYLCKNQEIRCSTQRSEVTPEKDRVPVAVLSQTFSFTLNHHLLCKLEISEQSKHIIRRHHFCAGHSTDESIRCEKKIISSFDDRKNLLLYHDCFNVLPACAHHKLKHVQH